MTTLAELARAWHAEVDRTSGSEDIGDLLTLDRAIVETAVVTREDLVALLGVCISDFRTHHEDATGELSFDDGGDELVWKAINAAHKMLMTG